MFFGVISNNTKTQSSSYTGTGSGSSSSSSSSDYTDYINSSDYAKHKNLYDFEIYKKEILHNLSIQAKTESSVVNTNAVLADTGTMVKLIYGSDANKDGTVSQNELNQAKITYEIQIKYINILKSYYPDKSAEYDKYIDICENTLSNFNLIENNYSSFSTKGTANVIDAEDLSNLYNKASTDGKYIDFSNLDLQQLTGDSSSTKQYTFSDWTSTMDNINADQTAETTIASDIATSNIMSNIVFSDLDENGFVTAQELITARTTLQQRYNNIFDSISDLEELKEMSPDAQYTEQINRLLATQETINTRINSIRYISDNFEMLNTTGNSSFLDSDDLLNIHLASKTDGRSADLSNLDIQILQSMG